MPAGQGSQNGEIPQFYPCGQAHHHKHGKENDGSAGIPLNLTKAHGDQSVNSQKHYMQRPVNPTPLPQGIQVLGKGQDEAIFTASEV